MTAPEEAKSEVEAAFSDWYGPTPETIRDQQDKLWARKAFAAGAVFGMNETVKLVKEGK